MDVLSVLRHVPSPPPGRIGIVSVDLHPDLISLRVTYRGWPEEAPVGPWEVRTAHGVSLQGAGGGGRGSERGEPRRQHWTYDWHYERPDDTRRLVVVEPTTGAEADIVLERRDAPGAVRFGLATSQDRELFTRILAHVARTGLDDTLPVEVLSASSTGGGVLKPPVEVFAVERWRGCDLFRGHTHVDVRDPGLMVGRVWAVESDAGTRTGITMGGSQSRAGTFLDIAVPTAAMT